MSAKCGNRLKRLCNYLKMFVSQGVPGLIYIVLSRTCITSKCITSRSRCHAPKKEINPPDGLVLQSTYKPMGTNADHCYNKFYHSFSLSWREGERGRYRACARVVASLVACADDGG